jgi:hypothetical protein
MQKTKKESSTWNYVYFNIFLQWQENKALSASGNSNLCFRPLNPRMEDGMCIIWKKYQVFSKASEKFMAQLKEAQKEIMI